MDGRRVDLRCLEQAGFFDVDERLQRLSEIFRAPLEVALAYADGLKGGRPARLDAVVMFKILVIQAQNDLSDDRTEFLINDRLSFMRFLGLALLRAGSGRQDDLAVPGKADPRRGDRDAR